MPKIDPSQLLDCLDSLMGSEGGIKGETEVTRLVVLMTKFSKKLVSKCIYILILMKTEPDLLARFMAEGGWALVFQWLDEGICNNNYPLIREILQLLLKCPISLERLKENNCPKVVKGLSKDSECEEVKRLAGKLVEQWLKFIKSGQAAISDVAMSAVSSTITVLPSNVVVSTVPMKSDVKNSGLTRKIAAKPGIQIVRKVTSTTTNEEDEEHADEDDEEEDEVIPPVGSLPLYKITVRDGKSVLAKVGTKTLTLPVKKPTEGELESGGVTSVVLKSDPVTKKFRYVTKPITEKDKSDASERGSEEKSKSVNATSETLAKAKLVVLPEKNEIKKVEDVKGDGKTSEKKHGSLKPQKDGSKSKDSHGKIKSSRDSENYKSDSKHKDRERKSSRDSDKDRRKSDHKSHKTDKSRDRDRDKDKDKDKDREKEKLKKKEKEASREKHKDGEREKEKVLTATEKAQIQADKDRNTLERLKTPAISLLGKIPKKSTSQSSTEKPAGSNSPVGSKPAESGEEPGGDGKKLTDARTPKVRPKTVKTYNSKFRSTGLEEEIKPPPSRSSIKKKLEEKRPPTLKVDASGKGVEKLAATAKDAGAPPEKKPKMADIGLEIKKEKTGGIKLIPPKPKPTLLESDMFSDALTASTKLEPRKRKRRTSSSKEAPEVKKEVKEETGRGTSPDVTSPKDLKPALKFYRDTLEDEEEKSKENAGEGNGAEAKGDSDGEGSGKQATEAPKPGSKLYPNGVLVYKTKKGPKKSVKWKEDAELTSVRLFELDETERVNVTRTFVDMKQMERSHEREVFQLAKKLATDDKMEEKIPWGTLYEVDIPPDRRSTVEPGNSSLEKNVQYAREKTVLQAIYFNRGLIPDSPAEPDPEVHPTTDPKIIPLDDITGNSNSICNFQNIPWPEPKPGIVPSSPPPGVHHQIPGGHNQNHPHQHQQHHHQQTTQQHQHQHHQQQQQHQQHHPQGGFPTGYTSGGNFPGFPQMGMPGIGPPGQGNWRPGDGKDMGMNVPFQQNGPLCPQMGQPPNMFNPGGPDGFAMNGPPPMGGFNPGYPMPCDPNMYGPPMGPMGMGGPPPPGPGQWNRGGGWQGGRPFMGPMNMQQKFQKGVCHHFAKFGNCARGSSCRFMHPN